MAGLKEVERRILPPPPPGRDRWPWVPTSSESSSAVDTLTCPLVSVVIPSFRQGHFIEETIRSILLQDYPRIELIVMDGGSKDDTVTILEKYDPWISHWVSEADRGQTHAINKGLQVATGEIITYLNSDDLFHPGAVTRVVQAFEANPDAGVVHGACIYVDEWGEERYRQNARVDDFVDYLRIWERFPRGDYLTQPEAFIRASALRQAGPFREELHSVMDFEMWLRLLSNGCRFLSIPEPVAHFRTYPAQKSSVDPGYELSEVIAEYARKSIEGVDPERQRKVLADLREARAQLLLRAAVAATILNNYPRAIRYSFSAVADDPRVALGYPFWSVMAHPLKAVVGPERRAAIGRFLRRDG